MTKTTDIEETRDFGYPTNLNHDRFFSGIRKILVPIDLTVESRKAINDAVNLAQIWNAHLTLLHVYQEPYNSCYLRGSHVYDAIKEHRQNREHILQLLGEAVRERYPNCSTEFRQGSLCDEIAKAANDLQADLMIIGTQGNKWFRRIAYGSDADAIVRRASCPVLVVLEHDDDVVGLNWKSTAQKYCKMANL
jgi:nucleotide-binding universal stress UspA family protein